jgi:hypothetical protein
MRKAELIQKHAEELRALHETVHAEYRKRTESASHTGPWREAARRFQQSYDQLAFPGGLANGMSRLAAHDLDVIESTVIFLEVDALFFRSGYIKEDLLDRLRSSPLDEDQKRRLQQVILARVRDPKTRREFRRWCQLAPFVSDRAFEEEIAKLADSSGTKPNRAQWVLEHLRQEVPAQKK